MGVKTTPLQAGRRPVDGSVGTGMKIEVTAYDTSAGWTVEVALRDHEGATNHRVTLSDADYQRLTAEQCTPEHLVRESFEFLLEREPRESILRSFDLASISRYFPEYEREISQRVRSH
jgi:hypothetical protein